MNFEGSSRNVTMFALWGIQGPWKTVHMGLPHHSPATHSLASWFFGFWAMISKIDTTILSKPAYSLAIDHTHELAVILQCRRAKVDGPLLPGT
jgi:hypothetical protein